ncbi:MAG: sucrase ferredoxin [Actinomycetota bacterium]|nr:sucrase ferredoxin [Actinomycetota bacterium]
MIASVPELDPAAELRCATRSRVAGLDPIGTIGSYDGYLLVDVALPWPSDLATVDEIAAVRTVLSGSGIRFQATVPAGAPATGERRVALYRRVPSEPPGPSRAPQMVRTEAVVAISTGDHVENRRLLVAAAEGLVAGVTGVAGVAGATSEVLVCTHGRHDVCCGARGSRLHEALVVDPGQLGSAVSVRRTSHTGGHRFAPTAIVLPEGTAWAYLDVDVLRSVVTRTGPVAAVLDHYRGWSGLDSPRLQALERAVLGEVGWDLLDLPRWGEDVDGVARLHVEGPSPTTWEATLSPGRQVPRAECGVAGPRPGKADTEMIVGGLRTVV